MCGATVLIAALVGMVPPTWATPPTSIQHATAQIETYFNGLTTLQANFTQTQSDMPGQTQSGIFMVNRPKGQFVWQYLTPVKQKVVGTGTAVYYIDQSARAGDSQVTQLPLDAGLGRLLRGGALKLAAVKLHVQSIENTPAGQRIVLVPTAAAGNPQTQMLKRLTLTFTTSSTQPVLAGFSALDGMGVTTQVSLTAVKTGVPLKPSLFAYTPPQQRVR